MIHRIKRLHSLGAGLTLSLLCFSAVAHNGNGDELPWQACSEAQKSDRCEYTNSHNDVYRGSCQIFNDALMCVRNQPILRGKKLNSEDVNKGHASPSEPAETQTDKP